MSASLPSGAGTEPSAEEDARLDADPRQRVYDFNRIEAPIQLAPLLGGLLKLIVVQQIEGTAMADYAVEYWEHMKLARASDPTIDFDRFLSAQLKILESKLDTSGYDYDTDFDPAVAVSTQLRNMLQLFAREVIRYAPVDLFTFAIQYFTELSENGGPGSEGNNQPDHFLNANVKQMNEKLKQIEFDKKRMEAKANRAERRKSQQKAET